MSSKKNTKATKATTQYNLKSMNRDIQAVTINNWDWDRLIITEPTQRVMQDGTSKYYQVYFNYVYDKDNYGPAILSLGKHYCFGIQKNDDKQNNYKVPIVMTSENKERGNEAESWELNEVEFFNKLKDKVYNFMIDNKLKIGKKGKSDDLIKDQMTSPLYYSKDKNTGEIAPGFSPKLYTNVYYNKNEPSKSSHFYGPGDKEIEDPTTLSEHFHITPNIRINSVFIGSQIISIKTGVYDATYEPKNTIQRKRLAPTNHLESVVTNDENDNDEDEIVEMIYESDSDEE